MVVVVVVVVVVVAIAFALLARTSGLERMCKKQFSVLHLASRACTSLDTEHALR